MKRIVNSPIARWLFVATALLFLAACQMGGGPANADLTVAVAGDGSGTVTGSPGGIDCTGAEGDDCTATFPVADETEVSLTATAAAGSAFAGWTGGGCASAGATCTVTVTGDTTVTATFDDAPQGDPITESFSVAAEADDVEELVNTSASNATAFPAGHTYAESSDLDLAYDATHETEQFIGLRFSDVTVPDNATITSATIDFVATGNGTAGDVSLTIYGEAAAAPAAFADDADEAASSDVSARTSTAAEVMWDISGAWAGASTQSSADISAVVQEIVGLEGWASGNDMVVILTGENTTDYRTVESFGTGRTAPVLNVTYTLPLEAAAAE
ncbi:MAG: hypothetical protein WD314_04820 [Trueperaceae bacterium]